MSHRRLIRINIAAQRLGVCQETLKRWLRAGHLKGIKTAGGHWRVPEDEVASRLKTTTYRYTAS